jgi:hypothetical protein
MQKLNNHRNYGSLRVISGDLKSQDLLNEQKLGI